MLPAKSSIKWAFSFLLLLLIARHKEILDLYVVIDVLDLDMEHGIPDLDMVNGTLSVESPNDPQLPALLFVKFHKVGGTSMQYELKERYSNYSMCADHECSLAAARKMRDCKNRKEFRHALDEFDWVPSGAEVKTFTLLRDPAERLRSKYFFRRAQWCTKKYGENCSATRMSFLEWMNYSSSEHGDQGGKDLESCCEYTKVLGQMNLKKALRSLDYFDIVGITEHMERSMNEINRAFGVYNHALVTEEHRNNKKAKLPWTEEERELADKLTRTDRIIYEKAWYLAGGWGKARRREKQQKRTGVVLRKVNEERKISSTERRMKLP